MNDYLQFQTEASDQCPLWEKRVAKLHGKKQKVLQDMHTFGIEPGIEKKLTYIFLLYWFLIDILSLVFNFCFIEVKQDFG